MATPEEIYVLNHPDVSFRRSLNPQFEDVNFSRDWLQRGGIYDFNPRQHDRKGFEKTLEGMVEKGYSRLAQDRARLGGLNYPAYQGKTLAPMSDLTQRARGLQEYYAGKPTPYSNKISSVLSRPTGLSDNSISGLLNNTGGRQRDYGNSLLGKLQKEFRSSYNDRVNRFQRKSGRDIDRGVGEFRGKLGDIKTLSSNLDQNANIATAKALQGLSGQKQARRNLLIDNLEQFGKQKQGLTNLQLKADKAAFDAEVQAPFEKANRLEEVLNRGNNAVRGELHPDLEKPMVDQINQAMTAYNAPNQKYQGEMIAGSNPELDTSQELMGRLSSKFRDSFYPERKELTGRLSNAERSVSESALDNVPEAIRGQIDQLEYAGKKRLKSDLGRLSNKYTRLGQYGSPQHMREAEQRARELNESILEQRNKLTEGNLKNQLQMQHQSNIGDIKKLGMLGDQGQQEFGDSITNIRDLNRLGSTKWQNSQAENEELYKNYMNEAMWMWPHMRGQAMNGGRRSGQLGVLNDVYNLMQNNNVSLENLNNLNTRYQEMERELDRYRDSSNRYLGDLQSLQQVTEARNNQLSSNRNSINPVTRDQRNRYLQELYKVVSLHSNPDYNVRSEFDNQPLMQKYNIPSNAPQLYNNESIRRMYQNVGNIANTNRQATWPMRTGDFIIPAERDPQYNWPIVD